MKFHEIYDKALKEIDRLKIDNSKQFIYFKTINKF